MIPILTTLVGSIIPFLNISPNSFLRASYPKPGFPVSRTFDAITSPDKPAFFAIVLTGIWIALWTISIPAISSNVLPFLRELRIFDAFKSAVPPPATIPSSIAARVAFNESSMRSFVSPTSTSFAPPTLMTATPPVSLERRS